MTIQRAMQLEEVNNELITVLLGLTARVRTAVKMLRECDHNHANVHTVLTTFQAEELLRRVASSPEDVTSDEDWATMAWNEPHAEKEAATCPNPHCVDGLAPRKTGPDDGDVDMESCPVCGGPSAV